MLGTRGNINQQYEERRTYQTATRMWPVVGKCGQPHGYVCSRPLSLHLSKQGTDRGGEQLPTKCPCRWRRKYIRTELWTPPYRFTEHYHCRLRILDSRQLDRLQDVLDHIAYDKEYYVPERGYGMHRWLSLLAAPFINHLKLYRRWKQIWTIV